ncbi:MAG: DUF1934 domain-containing protein [Peptococcaceae bacterium]|nr:DUF1934 domain-containing protein [Peptococcaceae bacterium]
MRKQVWVTVRGERIDDQGEKELVELGTKADLFRKNDSIYIVYSESAISGQEGTITSWKAEPTRVTLNKMGTAEVRQVFERGIQNQANYVTPFGSLPVSVLPWKVEVDLTEVGGSINLEYELELSEQKIGYHVLSLTVEEV